MPVKTDFDSPYNFPDLRNSVAGSPHPVTDRFAGWLSSGNKLLTVSARYADAHARTGVHPADAHYVGPNAQPLPVKL